MQRPRDAQRSLERAISLAPGLPRASSSRALRRIRQSRRTSASSRRCSTPIRAPAASWPWPQPTPTPTRPPGRSGCSGHATERYPDHAETYVALGRLWFEEARNGDSRRARQGASRHSSTRPRWSRPAKRSVCSARRSCRRRSLRSPRTSSSRRPKSCRPIASTFLHLAEAAERLGNTTRPARALRRLLLAPHPNDRRRGDIARRIADLSLRVGEPCLPP